MKIPTKVVAEAIRMEQHIETGDLYLVFKVTDSHLKQEILRDWMQEIELKLVGKKLHE